MHNLRCLVQQVVSYVSNTFTTGFTIKVIFNTAFNRWIFDTKGELPIKRMVIENSICWECKSWWTRSDIEYSPMSNVKVDKFQIFPSRSCSVGIERGFFCHRLNSTKFNFLSPRVTTKNNCVIFGWNLTVLTNSGSSSSWLNLVLTESHQWIFWPEWIFI